SSAAASRRSPVDHSPTSPVHTTVSPPAARISSATWLTGSPGRSLRTSRAPARDSPIASARPSPLPAPVTIATLPSRLLIDPPRSAQLLVAWAAEDSAVGDELAARRVRRVVGRQERDQAGDLDRLGHPGDRQRLEE